MPGQPKVSVVIPTYNREHQVTQAIRSVINQTIRPEEIIVVDDGSTDKTKSKVQAIDCSYLKLVSNLSNSGANAARNKGIHIASGEYISFLDSDDIWLPNKLEKQIDAIESAPGKIGAVYSGHYRKYPFSQKCIFPEKRWAVGDVEQIAAKGWGASSTSLIMMSSDVLNDIDGFDETLPAFQDWDLVFRASKKCSFACVPEPLAIRFEFYDDQISTDIDAQKRAINILKSKWKRSIVREYGRETWRSLREKFYKHLYWQATISHAFYSNKWKSINNLYKYVSVGDPQFKNILAGLIAALTGKKGYKAATRVYYNFNGVELSDIIDKDIYFSQGCV